MIPSTRFSLCAFDRNAKRHRSHRAGGAGLSFGIGGFESQPAILFESADDLDWFVSQGLDTRAEVGAMGDEKDRHFASRIAGDAGVRRHPPHRHLLHRRPRPGHGWPGRWRPVQVLRSRLRRAPCAGGHRCASHPGPRQSLLWCSGTRSAGIRRDPGGDKP